MALPQQGTETGEIIMTLADKFYSVNGLTPTGDGNVLGPNIKDEIAFCKC